jgi:phage shock protein PspC (stress-responsive transcriptional regulator)
MADAKKKLTRSKDDRWLAGVCGGLAEYFNVDGTLIRVLFILFSFAVGGGILIYIILWIIMPEAAEDVEEGDLLEELKSEEGEVKADEPEPVVEEEEPAEEEESAKGEDEA